MSIGITIRFLAGRYHATPWDHQVNEGVVEWPPSPWRILRALVSAYYRLPQTAGQKANREAVCCLLERLTEQLPGYVLPVSVTAHTRHYMPARKEGKHTTTKVFDTFLLLGGGTLSSDAEVQVIWNDVDLTMDEVGLLRVLCSQVSYLGRAESWAELSVIDSPDAVCNTMPLQDGVTLEAHSRVLVPLDAAGLRGFQAAIAMLPQPKKGKAKWKAPADILEALELDVGKLHSQGWNGIPGTRWVMYGLPKRVHFSRSVSQEQPIFMPENVPTFARFALDSSVLPKLTDAVAVGDRFHRALIKWSDGLPDSEASIFTGRDKAGNVLGNDHQHAWYLPEDADGDGKIDHVVVYAAVGFSAGAVAALSNLPKVWGPEGFDLQTVLVALGQAEDYRAEVGGESGRSLVVGRGRVWRSITPVVLPRFPKQNRQGEPKIDPATNLQIDGAEHQVRRLLRQLGFAAPLSVETLPERQENRVAQRYGWQQFRRRRYDGHGAKGMDRGYGFELRFEEVQVGPMALGYGAHFGLGMFVPVE
jgi:CRISPR-associated protein Csb2